MRYPCDDCLMDNAGATPVTQKVAIIRPQLLKRLKENSGIVSDEAFARSFGASRSTLDRLREECEPSLRVAVGIAKAYGLGLGEVILMLEDAHTEPISEEGVEAA